MKLVRVFEVVTKNKERELPDHARIITVKRRRDGEFSIVYVQEN